MNNNITPLEITLQKMREERDAKKANEPSFQEVHVEETPKDIARRNLLEWMDEDLERTDPFYTPIRYSKNKKLIKLMEDHKKSMAKKKFETDKQGNPHPKFPLNVHAKEWTNELLSQDPLKDLVTDVTGVQLESHSNFIPQRKTFKILCKLNTSRLRACAFQWALNAQTMGIEVDETSSISSGTVGTLYMMYLTIYYDLLLACSGEQSIFVEAQKEYAVLRSALTPRVIKGFSYSFDMDDVASMESQMATGIPFIIPTGDSEASLSWKTGTATFNRDLLTNTIPVVLVEDLMDPGVEATVRVWSRMARYHDTTNDLYSMYSKTGYERTAACFAQVIGYGQQSYRPFCRIESEVPLRGDELYLGALDLVNGSNRRGNYCYNETRGTGVLSFRIFHNQQRRHHFRLIPKQIPLESLILSYTTGMLQADLIANEVPLAGNIVQPTNSYMGMISSGEVTEALSAAFCKRYSLGATIMSGVDALNEDLRIVGAGRQYYVPMEVLNFHIGVDLQESMAELTPFTKVVGEKGNFSEIVLPHLILGGVFTRANTLENYQGGDSNSLVSLLQAMYPRIGGASDYKFGSPSTGGLGPGPDFLDISSNDIGLFSGAGPAERRTSISDLGLRLQGNVAVGSVMANVHDSQLTNLYYTELLESIDPQNPWSHITSLTIKSIANRYAFDPNKLADNLMRILPVNFADSQLAYIGLTKEVVSIDIDAPYIEYKIPEMVMVAHPVQGPGVETVISDLAKIRQHVGGGFIDVIRTGAGHLLPLLGQLGGGLADAYLPGSGVAVKGLSEALAKMIAESGRKRGSKQQAHVDSLLQSVMRESWKNPYAPILRPSTNGLRARSEKIRRI